MMRRVVLDENLPRDFAEAFKTNGYEVLDVRDYELRGAPDGAIFDFASQQKAALATSDLEFVQRLQLLQSHEGIFLIRLSSRLSIQTRVKEIARALGQLNKTEIKNHTVVISLGQVRLHGGLFSAI